MAVYAGIDLHSTNCMIVVQDDTERIKLERRVNNDLSAVLSCVEPFRAELRGIVVESTYNWYWLVDGLRDAKFPVHLANTVAIQQYGGLKYRDDRSDARWLARLLQLGLLPEGHVYPREARSLRDLLRRRIRLVRQATRNLLTLQSMGARYLGRRFSANRIKALTLEQIADHFADPHVVQAAHSTLQVYRCLRNQIDVLEKSIYAELKPRPGFHQLQTVPGIGPILASTILLESGDLGRFPSVRHFVSYCRMVGSTYVSNGKRKGAGNVKNGNPYLCWSFIEAATFAMRYAPAIRGYYERKAARSKSIVAKKAVAHKLARACFHMLKDDAPFNVQRAFGVA